VTVGALLLVNGTDNLLLSNATDDLLLASSSSIDAALLTSAYDAANATSYTTASVSPAADSLLLIFVTDTITAAIAPKAVPTGLSLTWEELGTRTTTADDRRVSAYIAQCGGTPGSGTITLTENDQGGGTTATSCTWSVIQITGHHVVSPVRQVAFPQSLSTAATTSASFVLPATAADSNSRAFAWFQISANTTLTPRASWSELSDNTGASPGVASQAQWRSDAFEGTFSATYASSADAIAVGLEIATATAPAAVTMATIASQATTAGIADSTITATMPAGITAGDLLIATVSTDGNTSAAAGGGEGWTNITDTANASAVRLNILAKIAAGGDALNLTLGAAVDSATHVMRIVDHGVSTVATDVEVGTAATGTSATPDPPAVTPAASAKNLFIAVAASDDDDDINVFAPTSYVGDTQRQSASSATACLIQVAYRHATTGSAENPAAFALAASEEWVTQTLCVPPASAGATGTAAVTEADDTSTASGTETFTGTSTTTEAADTSTATGTETFTGTSATTEEADTSTASGTHTENVTGSAAVTEADDTSSAAGTETFTGTSATTEADDVSTATAIETFTGTSATTEADDTATASGTVGSVGGISATLHPVSTFEPAAAVSTLEPATTVHTFAPATTVRTFNA
jgi:hypothetical protein